MNIKVLTFVSLILMLFTLGNRDVYDANGSLSRDVVGSLDIRNKTSNPYTASSPVIVGHLALLDYKIPSKVSTPVKNTSNIKKLENDFINEIRFVDIVNSPLETNLGVLLSDLEVTSLLELEVNALPSNHVDSYKVDNEPEIPDEVISGVLLSDLEVTSLLELEVNALPSNHVYSYKVDNEPEIPDEVISRLLEDISNPHAFIHDDLKHLEIIFSEDKVIDLMKEELLLLE